MSSDPILMTPDGIRNLRRKLEALERRLREVVRQKGEAAVVGGNVWHDNFAFEQLEREERMLSWQIAQHKELLARAKVVTPPAGSDTVQIGTCVELEFDDGRVKTLTIGGPMESEPSAGIISYQSPLGRALLGARVGEIREYAVEGRRIAVTIRRIGTREALDG